MSEQNVIHGPKRQLPVRDVNVGLAIYDNLKERDQNDVIIEDPDKNKTLTIGELLQSSFKLSKSIVNAKLIAIASENDLNYFKVVLAALFAGVPIALIDPNHTSYELRAILAQINPEYLFCSSAQSLKFTKTLITFRDIKKLIVIDAEKKTNQYESLESFSSGKFDFYIKNVNTKEDVAFILFSSGTTGLSKGVMLTHLNVNATISSITDPSIKSTIITSTTLAILPFHHVYGLYVVLVSLLDDKKIIFMKKFNFETYLRIIEKYKIARCSAVPPIVQMLLKNPLVDKFDLSSVKEIGSGAAPLSEATVEAIKKKFKCDFRQGYGLTESGYGVTLTPLNNQRPGSVGIPYPGMSVVVKDLKTGKNLPAFDQGEICVRSDAVMKGYYNNPKATKASFADGWLRTGDIGYYDYDGYFYIVDRMKEVIKYKGFQVPPAELEAILLTHQKIKDVGVVGKPDDDAGELPTAFVVKQPGAELNENEVKFYLAGFVKRQKHLHGGVYFIDEIPRTNTGKIKRKDLKSLLIHQKSKL